jgi:hypothetical protein
VATEVSVVSGAVSATADVDGDGGRGTVAPVVVRIAVGHSMVVALAGAVLRRDSAAGVVADTLEDKN